MENPNQLILAMSTKEKFRLAAQDSFDPYAYLLIGILAGVQQAEDSPKAWHQGWSAFGKRYAATFADQTDGNMMTEAIVPALFKQDPRYIRRGQGAFFSRTGYAVSRIFITRTDAGGKMFNSPNSLATGLRPASPTPIIQATNGLSPERSVDGESWLASTRCSM